MYKYLSLRKIQIEEAEILKNVVYFFNKEKLKYYISCGTLLGAIRHKGFIPWDDDIDLMMPRNDYEKMKKILKNKKILPNYIFMEYEDTNYCRILNTKFKVDKSKCDCKMDYLWIDIFPMDGLADTEKKYNKIRNKIFKLENRIVMLTSSNKELKEISVSKIKYYLKVLFLTIIKPVKKVYLLNVIKQHNNYCQKYKYDESKYVGVLGGGLYRERMLKEHISDYEVVFEGLKVNTVSCFDEYLKYQYGDYMKLPPIEQRINHKIYVYENIK